jgi:hypothetical protein
LLKSEFSGKNFVIFFSYSSDSRLKVAVVELVPAMIFNFAYRELIANSISLKSL